MKMKNFYLRHFLSAVLLAALPSLTLADGSSPNQVSFIALLANTKNFEGKEVAISGFLASHDETAYLFQSKEAAAYWVLENSINLGSKKDLPSEIQKVDREFITLLGTFHTDENIRTLSKLTLLQKLHALPWYCKFISIVFCERR